MDTALKKGSQNGGVSAIVDELPFIRGLSSKYCCKYTITSTIYKLVGFVVAFLKGSPLVLDFSRVVMQVTEKTRWQTKVWGSSKLHSTEGTYIVTFDRRA